MVEPNNIAKLELQSVTPFQYALHGKPKKEDDDEDENVDSRFSYDLRKFPWSVNLLVKLSSTRSGDNEVIYTVNSKFNYLLWTCLRQRLIPLRVKKELINRVEIAWPHNLALNIPIHADLQFNGDVKQNFDSVWLNIQSQYYMKGKRKHFQNMIGNIPFLEQWSTCLPEFVVQAPQPWYYAKHEALAIPLFLSVKEVTHTYTIRSKLSELLRMRIKRDDGTWKEIAYNFKFIEGATADDTLPTPELWGRYALALDNEVGWAKQRPDNKVYIDDIVTLSKDDPKTYGAPVEFELHTEQPCKAIFWVAENVEAKEHRNFSNFTTNGDNLFEGWNPIVNAKLMYGTEVRFNLDSDVSDRMEPWYMFPSSPCEIGYNAQSIAYDSSSINADTGIVFKNLNAKLIVRLGDTDPFLKQAQVKRIDGQINSNELILDELNDHVDDHNNKPKFIVHARLLVQRDFTF